MNGPVFESAYDVEATLRLLRISGPWDVDGLLARAPNDPTIVHVPECVTIVDLRGLDVSASPSEVEQLASFRREGGVPPFADRYAWVIDSPKTIGIALLFGRMVGAGPIRRFETVEDAVAHLGLDIDAYHRAEAGLTPVE